MKNEIDRPPSMPIGDPSSGFQGLYANFEPSRRLSAWRHAPRLRKTRSTSLWRIVATALLVMGIESGDAQADLAPGLHTGLSLTQQGTIRTYDVLVPVSYDGSKAVPLIIDIHGYSVTSTFHRSISGFAAIAEAEGFIVAWPQGFGTWNAGFPCADVSSPTDDVGFIRAVVAAIVGLNWIDSHRIYATGLSCGGAMTHRLACEAADLFAAAASFSWTGPLVFLRTVARHSHPDDP